MPPPSGGTTPYMGQHVICQVKYLNEIMEQDHRAVKRITRPVLGFKSFDAAQNTLTGIELMHMLKTQQLVVEHGNEGLTAAKQFYALAA
jgi:putative transposase